MEPQSETKLQFEALAVPHIHALLRTARRTCRNSQLAEDLVQETMLRAWKSFGQFGSGSCKAWLFTIMLRLWHRERLKLYARIKVEIEPEQPGAAISGTADSLEQKMLAQQVLARIDGLPSAQREILLLSVVEGFSAIEVAGILQLPVGTVMSRLSRGRAAIRKAVDLRQFTRQPMQPLEDAKMAQDAQDIQCLGGKKVRSSFVSSGDESVRSDFIDT